MGEDELITKIVELSKSSIGFPLIFWGAYLLKVYVINGNVRRYFSARRRELRAIRGIGARIDRLIELHTLKELNTHQEAEEDERATIGSLSDLQG